MTQHKPILGLVGGIGSGKSTVATALARRGGRVVAGDPAGHEALRQPDILGRIEKRWPAAIHAGQVDRRSLGRLVFADPRQRQELEAIVFPWIKQRLNDEIAAARSDPAVRFIVLDAAVMLEAGWNGTCDWLIFVDAPREVRAARVAGRGWSADDLDRRERSQMSLGDKRNRADAVIDNSGDVGHLEQQLDELLARWELAQELTRT